MSAFVVVTTSDQPSLFSSAWKFNLQSSGVLIVENTTTGVEKFYAPGVWKTLTVDPSLEGEFDQPGDDLDLEKLPPFSVHELDD